MISIRNSKFNHGIFPFWRKGSNNENTRIMKIFYVKQVCIPVGCVTPACCPYLPVRTAQGGVCSAGCLLRGDVCSHWVSAPGAGGDLCSRLGSFCYGGFATPVNRMIDRCKNITLEFGMWFLVMQVILSLKSLLHRWQYQE